MYRKAVFFDDHASAAAILGSATPTEAGALGRKVKGFDTKRWKEVVAEVAEEGCWLKFSQVKECREALLETGERVLVEASPVDRNWVSLGVVSFSFVFLSWRATGGGGGADAGLREMLW